MYHIVHTLVKSINGKSDLTVEERNLLLVAYKNMMSARYPALRTLHKEEDKGNELIKTYKKVVEREMEDLCQDILNLLSSNLIPATQGTLNQPQVFYLKMAGDCCRYLTGFVPRQDYNKQAADYYGRACQIAFETLSPIDPLRLGLALNCSIFLYENLNDQKKACELAKKAFDDALSKLDQLDDISYKHSSFFMQMLRDNATFWSSGSFIFRLNLLFSWGFPHN